MKIQIIDSVLVGNMGMGWVDEKEAAHAYAEYLKSEYEKEAANRFPGADIEVDISVQNAGGWSNNAQVLGVDIDEVIIGEFERDLADGRY